MISQTLHGMMVSRRAGELSGLADHLTGMVVGAGAAATVNTRIASGSPAFAGNPQGAANAALAG
jgi:hypothetical protein